MIVAIDAVKDTLRLEPRQEAGPNLDGTMAVLTALKAQIDAKAVPDETLKRQADGEFAQGLHQLVRSDLIGAETPAETVATIVGWIEFACSSTNPETDAETEAEFESSQSWGSPSAHSKVPRLCSTSP